MPDLEHFDIITADNFTPLDLSVLGSANDMIHNSVNLIVHKVTEERVIFVQVLKGSWNEGKQGFVVLHALWLKREV